MNIRKARTLEKADHKDGQVYPISDRFLQIQDPNYQ